MCEARRGRERVEGSRGEMREAGEGRGKLGRGEGVNNKARVIGLGMGVWCSWPVVCVRSFTI